jgi:hypothetical protein
VHGILRIKNILKMLGEGGFNIDRVIVGSALGVTYLINFISSPSLVSFLMKKGGVFVSMF